MTSSGLQVLITYDEINSNDNTTTFDDTTANNIITEELSTIDIVSTSLSNNCYPTCFEFARPGHANVPFITELICSFVVAIIFILVIGVFILRRRYQHSQKQQTKEEESLQGDKLYAHPFEEILVVVNEPQSIELVEIRQ